MPGPVKKNEIKTVKKKMQNVSFRNMEEFLEFLPEDELKIVELLRKIIFSCLPGCSEKLSYNVPFYKLHANICFIWPSSVKWGSKGQDGVQFGFTKGYLLTDETGYLDKGNRKQVYWRNYHSLKEVNIERLRAYIFEAAVIDEEMMRKKKEK